MLEPIYQEIIKPQMMEKRVKEKSDSDKVKQKSSDTKTSKIMPRILRVSSPERLLPLRYCSEL